MPVVFQSLALLLQVVPVVPSQVMPPIAKAPRVKPYSQHDPVFYLSSVQFGKLWVTEDMYGKNRVRRQGIPEFSEIRCHRFRIAAIPSQF